MGEETIEEDKFETNSTRFVHAGMLLALALGTGVIVSELLAATGITFPGYMGALLMGVCYEILSK